jgi:uncharacterized membrane protein
MKNKILLGLTVAGLLFSGYLSGVKLFSGTCAFNEGCPLFFGLPACYFGFAMFLTLTALVVLCWFGKLTKEIMLQDLFVVSLCGILFAGYFTILELPLLFREGLAAYMLGLPTCALGFIFYVIIFVYTLRLLKTEAQH